MQKRAVLRLFTVFFICFSVIIYNVKQITSKSEVFYVEEEVKSEKTSKKEEEKEIVHEEQKIEEISKEEVTSKSESLSVSAGAIKGKIIEKYISPYSTGLSYNSVYIKNETGLDIDIKSLLNSKIGFKIEADNAPQVLIIHTHATESYMLEKGEYYTENDPPRRQENEKNMVKIGSIISQKLNDAGIVTLHDTTQHDYPNYTGSYSRAAETICSYLEKYPSIKVVLDVHRDSVASGESDKVKLTTEIEEKKAAQVMLVMGSQSGSVTNFPEWKENLKLAVKFQQKIEEKYPTLARPLMLMSKNYNESLTTGSMLLEIGTDANTLEEATYSAELAGNALAELLNNLKE